MSISGAEMAHILGLCGAGVLPAGAIAETYPRRMAAAAAALTVTSGTLYLFGVYLPACTVTSITFVSGTTAEASGTHLWYALYNQNLSFIAQTTDNTAAAALGASTALTQSLTATQSINAGIYYLGFQCTATTPPSLATYTSLTSVTNIAPIMAATSSTALTNAAPSPAGALTAITNCAYAYIS